MDWYLKVIIYTASCLLTGLALYQIDFNKFMRIGKKHFSAIVWLILSAALGFLIGSLFIELGSFF